MTLTPKDPGTINAVVNKNTMAYYKTPVSKCKDEFIQ